MKNNFSKKLLTIFLVLISFYGKSQVFNNGNIQITLENPLNVELCGNNATFNVTIKNISILPIEANSTISVFLPNKVLYVSGSVSTGFNDLLTTNSNHPVFTNQQVILPEAEIVFSYKVMAFCDEELSQWNAQTVSNIVNLNYVIDGENNIFTIDDTNTENPEYQISGFDIQLSATDYLCYGGENGSVTVSSNNSNTEHTFSCYNDNDELIDSYTGIDASCVFHYLDAGNYYIVAQNACGCILNLPFTINGPNQLRITSLVTQNETSPGSANGSITATVQGGTPNYSYLWIPGGQTTPTISQLTSGIYQLGITDANGCNTWSFASITDGMPLNVSLTPKNKLCYGDVRLGEVMVNVNNGVGLCSFIWSDGLTHPLIGAGFPISNWYNYSGFQAGNYSVTVTDATGNSATLYFTITEPTPIVLTEISHINPTCSNSTNGSSVINVTGGTPNYTFALNPAGYIQNVSFPNLTVNNRPNGVTQLTITDANGCSATLPITYTPQVAVLEMNVVISPACHGQNNGRASISIANYNSNMGSMFQIRFDTDINGFGGNSGYGTVGPSNSSLPLSTGLHYYGVIGSCQTSGSFTIPESYPVIESVTPIFESCDPYKWNVEVTATTISTLGDYQISATDLQSYDFSSQHSTTNTANILLYGGLSGYIILYETFFEPPHNIPKRCPSEAIPFTLPSNLQVTVSGIISACSTTSNGSINLTTTGGVAPYQYEWSNQTYSQNLSALPGIYTVTVTDANGCTSISGGEIKVFNATINSSIACYGQQNGSASVSIVNGSGNYSYLWSNGATTSSITNVGAGTYTVTVTDVQYQCSKVLTVEVLCSNPQIQNTISVDCSSNCNASALLTVSGSLGNSYTWQNSMGTIGNNTNSLSIQNLCPGSISNIQVTDNLNCSASISVVIPNVLNANISNTVITCSAPLGTATVNAVNGQAPYIYLWSNGSTSNSISNLSPGLYIVTVIDSYKCFIIDSVIIEPYVPMRLATNKYNNCVSTPGEASVYATGGKPPYTYLWKKNNVIVGTTSTITNLSNGNYLVTVTDSYNCTKTATVSIIRPLTDLVISTSHTFPTSHYSASAICNVTSGSPLYTYKWYNLINPNSPISTTLNTNATSNIINGLSQGAYSVVVVDNNLCKSVSKLCNKNFTYSISCSLVNSFTCQYTANANGGKPPYTYLWSNGETGQTTEGSRQVTITDADGCVAAKSNIVAVCFCEIYNPRSMVIESKFSVYPNPANDILTIEIDNTKEGNFSFQIFDILGKQVFYNSINLIEEREIDVSPFSNGLYYYRILLDNNVIYENKLIIQK